MSEIPKTNAMRLLDQAGIPYKVHTYSAEDGIDGLSVARSLEEDPDSVFKTLVTQGKSRAFYVFVIPVPGKLSLRQAAKACSEKSVEMIPQKLLLPTTGYVHGGCSPVGMKKVFPTFIDETAILFDRKGEFAGFYSKIHLVPFAEAIPFPDNPLVQFFMEEIVKFSAGWSAGSQYVLFRIPAGKGGFAGRPLEYGRPAQAVIPLNSDGCAYPQVTAQYTGETGENPDNFVSFTTPICFEDAFPDVCRKLHKIGSEVFINITNDSWSQTKSAEYQHFAAASYLAIEFRSTLVRCANAGYSVVLDPAGRILADMPLFTEGAMGTQVPVYRRTQTCFAALGDWFAWLLMGGLAAQVLYMLCTSRLPWRRKGIRLCIQIEFRETGGGQNA